MTDFFDKMLWAYRAQFTQTDVGGGIVNVRITANERTVILYGTVGSDQYAADRTLEIFVQDPNGSRIAQLLFPSPMDNERIPLIRDEAAAITDADPVQLDKILVLGKTDRLIINMATLVQNEIVTVAIRALIRSWPPTVVTTGSTGTVTTTTTYDKVI